MAREHEQTTTTEDPLHTPAAQPTRGPGAVEAQAMLARGERNPDVYVRLIDRHRSERDAIFALIQQSALGNAFVQSILSAADRLRIDIKRQEAVVGMPGAGDYLLVNKAGAEFSAAGGDLTGTVGKGGLNANYQLDDDSAIRLKAKGSEASLGWVEDGSTVGELHGRYKGGNDWSAGARRPFSLGEGTGNVGLRYDQTSEGGRTVVAGDYRDSNTTVAGYAGVQDGSFVAGANGRQNFDGGHHLAGNVELTPSQLRLGASGNYVFSPELQAGGALSHQRALDGSSDNTSLNMNYRYRSPTLVHGATVEGSTGSEGQSFGVRGDVTSLLGTVGNNHQVFGRAWGSYTNSSGKGGLGQIGGALDLTVDEKQSLTAFGIVNTEGAFEVGLSWNLFKSRIDATSLSDAKKNQLVSLFVSYTQGASPGMMNDINGRPSYSISNPVNTGSTVNAGIRINF